MARAGASAEISPGGAGPALALEGARVGGGWLTGARLDTAHRRVWTSRETDLALQAEVGRQVPVGRWQLEASLTAGAAMAWTASEGFCAPLDPDGGCSPDRRSRDLMPEAGAGLHLVSPDGRWRVGLRGRGVRRVVALGVTWGGFVSRRDPAPTLAARIP